MNFGRGAGAWIPARNSIRRSENMPHLRYDTGAGVRLRNVICYVTVRETETIGGKCGQQQRTRIRFAIKRLRTRNPYNEINAVG